MRNMCIFKKQRVEDEHEKKEAVNAAHAHACQWFFSFFFF